MNEMRRVSFLLRVWDALDYSVICIYYEIKRKQWPHIIYRSSIHFHSSLISLWLLRRSLCRTLTYGTYVEFTPSRCPLPSTTGELRLVQQLKLPKSFFDFWAGERTL